ncbi:divergent PAP2 family protein [Bacillus sp. RAR_GA_16]|uniref:divergent PAP2 family protein n=1 Tax=Bacillus sp. RAR_GA_16 TaxID=2876774 RepID=UPI001CCF5C1D|nr:divergent PAP2 family protein [Bacillus sp. RAR_GA_16]MCA0171456.1 divergent PAP2 family protein [Bacillus sp. RAR_GA_16]
MSKMNKGINVALSAIFLAQGLKILTHKTTTGKWDWRPLFQTGGMPSSHSAGVSALATYTALETGRHSIETALAVVFGVIVMYDAQGIRRHTGEIAQLVNDLDEDIELLSGHYPDLLHARRDVELNELLGHQPAEVGGGALLGIALGLLGYFSKK